MCHTNSPMHNVRSVAFHIFVGLISTPQSVIEHFYYPPKKPDNPYNHT